jgi:hypothetical protein
MMRVLLALLVSLVITAPAAALGERVTVTFEFPDREPVRVDLTYEETVELIHEKLNYDLRFWVSGALKKARLSSSQVHEKGGLKITAIGGVADGPEGRWVYWVNGIRSPYHIDNQLSVGVRTIRFRYVKDR